MNDWTVVHLHCEILLCNKEKWTIDAYNKKDGSQGHFAEWKKSQWKGHTLYDFIYITVSNGEIIEQISSCQGLGKAGGWELVWV